MALTKVEKELFEEKFRGVYARMDTEFDSIAGKLNNILSLMKISNGRMTEAEYQLRKLKEANLTKALTCPYRNDVNKLKEDKIFWTRAGKVLASIVFIASVSISILTALGVIF